MNPEWGSGIGLALTLGPACREKRMILELMDLQPEYFRINFSHDRFENNLRLVQELKEEFPDLVLYADLKGRDQRFRLYPEGSRGIPLQPGQQLEVYRNESQAQAVGGIFLDVDEGIRPDQVIAVDDAKSHLIVKQVTSERLWLEVSRNGFLKPNAGVTIDGETSSLAPTDAESLEHLRMLEPWIDGILVSHVRSASEIESIRRIFSKTVIAKIENVQAVERLESIAAVSSRIMIARGDLSMAFTPERIPIIQAEICRRIQQSGQSIRIDLATGFWESMQRQPNPTLAEITDLSTALQSGIRGFLLTGETAAGLHPVVAFSRLAQSVTRLISVLNIQPK